MNNLPDSQLNKKDNDYRNEIDLLELFHVLFQGKWIIVSVTAFVSIIGVVYSLSLPNIYKSEALLAPVNSASGISGALGNLSGLAGLTGVSLASGSDEDNSLKAIKKLSSLSFFENNILPYIFLPDLMALESWDPETNTLAYDENLYQKNTNTWVRDASYPNTQIPTAQESFRAFIGKHFALTTDNKTGFISLKIKHQSPFIAKQWADLMIKQVNTFYRQKDKVESEKAVSYLNQQITTTSLSEIKESIAELLQQQTKKLTLIEAKQLYVFESIDPPAVMELKSEPGRALICILIALFGGMLSIVLVLIKHYVFKKKVA